MAFDMEWSPAFCLACDRQTDGKVYCSESCRLAEYESASTASSVASSPTSTRAPLSWPGKPSNQAFFMEPAYNFAHAQPYRSTPAPRAAPVPHPARAHSSPGAQGSLTPSSSQSSLFSMQSSHSATSSEPIQLSDESRKALRAYASSFDQSRYSRRQSAH
ncbi:hypothetical protein BUE80_DR010872 [Diplocarpon rosae]|nr:hypothetical protein BUE80_DR010872 [Diplocarpon rosae]